MAVCSTITAAHCLEERTYQPVVGRLGSKPDVWAECRFADPIAAHVLPRICTRVLRRPTAAQRNPRDAAMPWKLVLIAMEGGIGRLSPAGANRQFALAEGFDDGTGWGGEGFARRWHPRPATGLAPIRMFDFANPDNMDRLQRCSQAWLDALPPIPHCYAGQTLPNLPSGRKVRTPPESLG